MVCASRLFGRRPPRTTRPETGRSIYRTDGGDGGAGRGGGRALSLMKPRQVGSHRKTCERSRVRLAMQQCAQRSNAKRSGARLGSVGHCTPVPSAQSYRRRERERDGRAVGVKAGGDADLRQPYSAQRNPAQPSASPRRGLESGEAEATLPHLAGDVVDVPAAVQQARPKADGLHRSLLSAFRRRRSRDAVAAGGSAGTPRGRALSPSSP